MYLSDKIIESIRTQSAGVILPEGISFLRPYYDSPIVPSITQQFYEKYYKDTSPRLLILGINPGRLGAGATGIPFTDTYRLENMCHLPWQGVHSFEPSSVFIYEVIKAFGGVQDFYNHVYISSVCPLGLVKLNHSGKYVNFNYYDDKNIELLLRQFIIQNVEMQAEISQSFDTCICLGTGKNYAYLSKLNKNIKAFKSIIPLEHPRYIMQYKNKEKERYIDEYIKILNH